MWITCLRLLPQRGRFGVRPHGFRLMNGSGHSERFLGHRKYEVWALGPRAIQEHGFHAWRTGVRQGPDAGGSRCQEAYSVFATPPGVRKTSARELIAFLHADGQMGFPPTFSTDASLGYLVTAYQSSEILFGHFGGDKFLLVRLEGTTSRGHSGSKAGLAQQAKVGYCPCCTVAAHVAVPPAYEAG